MRLCRFCLDDGVPLTGLYDDDRIVPIDQAVDAFTTSNDLELLLTHTEDLLNLLPPRGTSFLATRDLFQWMNRLNEKAFEDLSVPTESVRLLPPLDRPGKIFLMARNYADHSAEMGDIAAERRETFPYVFMKPATTIAGSGDSIVLPRISPDSIDWEVELGVVIGARCKNVAEENALDMVAGYTVVNDISDRGFRPNPGRTKRERDIFFDWLHGKWHDGSCPIGPCIRSADSLRDPQDLNIRLDLDNERMQDSNTSQMVFPVAAIVAFISSFVTLEPGDLIATGTPAGVGKSRNRFLRPGETLHAEIEGIGRLSNPVEAELDE